MDRPIGARKAKMMKLLEDLKPNLPTTSFEKDKPVSDNVKKEMTAATKELVEAVKESVKMRKDGLQFRQQQKWLQMANIYVKCGKHDLALLGADEKD